MRKGHTHEQVAGSTTRIVDTHLLHSGQQGGNLDFQGVVITVRHALQLLESLNHPMLLAVALACHVPSRITANPLCVVKVLECVFGS